jgi:hypothetical protein
MSEKSASVTDAAHCRPINKTLSYSGNDIDHIRDMMAYGGAEV